MTTDPTQTLMDYLTPTLGKANTIQLPNLPEGVTFDFKHGFIQMLENNPFNGPTHEDSIQHLRKFIKLTYTVRQNRVPAKYIILYVFPFSLNGKTCVKCLYLHNSSISYVHNSSNNYMIATLKRNTGYLNYNSFRQTFQCRFLTCSSNRVCMLLEQF